MAGRVDEACERSHVRRRETLMRTAKSCGPDAPTLASSLRRHVGPTGFWHAISANDGGKQARSPGRARRKPLKPLRRECRVFRGTCGDYTRVLPTHCTRGCGCTAHPAFPAPSVFEGEWLCARLRRFAPRGACGISAPSLRAQRSNPLFLSLRGEMDCFASLAMTVLAV